MKKNIIFYFSGTGNSLVVAREIATALGNTDLVSIPDSFGVDLFNYERIGFVYPIYFGGVPLIVKNFIESLDIPPSYLFAVATCGGSALNGLKEINALICAKGHSLNFGTILSMGGNYILLYGKSEKAEASNAQTTKELPDIASAIRDKSQRPCGKPNPIMTLFTNRFRKGVHKATRTYIVSDNCTSCGLCAKICPVHNIEMKDNKPIFGGKCEQCMACLQFCPQRAINGTKTAKRKRYHHPNITAQDLIRK
ncbi:iron-sulfur protein [Clostridia bacterium]|nr:iron-sulfur protein [Clostridia bacterium]